MFFAPRDAWGGWTSAAFKNLGPNIKLGVPAAILVMSEWWSWDLIAFASSYLGTYAFAANQVARSSLINSLRHPKSVTKLECLICSRLGGLYLPPTLLTHHSNRHSSVRCLLTMDTLDHPYRAFWTSRLTASIFPFRSAEAIFSARRMLNRLGSRPESRGSQA